MNKRLTLKNWRNLITHDREDLHEFNRTMVAVAGLTILNK
jgi:hypothetical protein